VEKAMEGHVLAQGKLTGFMEDRIIEFK